MQRATGGKFSLKERESDDDDDAMFVCIGHWLQLFTVS